MAVLLYTENPKLKQLFPPLIFLLNFSVGVMRIKMVSREGGVVGIPTVVGSSCNLAADFDAYQFVHRSTPYDHLPSLYVC